MRGAGTEEGGGVGAPREAWGPWTTTSDHGRAQSARAWRETSARRHQRGKRDGGTWGGFAPPAFPGRETPMIMTSTTGIESGKSMNVVTAANGNSHARRVLHDRTAGSNSDRAG